MPSFGVRLPDVSVQTSCAMVTKALKKSRASRSVNASSEKRSNFSSVSVTKGPTRSFDDERRSMAIFPLGDNERDRL
jgi:hypothetical protein